MCGIGREEGRRHSKPRKRKKQTQLETLQRHCGITHTYTLTLTYSHVTGRHLCKLKIISTVKIQWELFLASDAVVSAAHLQQKHTHTHTQTHTHTVIQLY